MAVLFIKHIFHSNLCSEWQHSATKFQTRLELPFHLNNLLKRSHRNHSRWPGRNPHENSAIQQDNFALSRLRKPFLFTIGVSGLSYAGAAIWQYENMRHESVLKGKWFYYQAPKYGKLRQEMNKWWQNLRAHDKVFVPICFINVLVFLAWQIPAFNPVMSRYFLAGLSSNALCLPMLLSVFSHYNILHLGCNMLVLRSFSEKGVQVLGKEQFVGLYFSAGMISSFTSYLYKAVVRSSVNSLGASGAVMCMLGFVCTKFPDSQLAVIFLPQVPFEAGTGLKAIIGFDTFGCILKWGFLDHAAHLGGALLGILWCQFGQDIWLKRGPLLKAWHKIRGPVK